MLEVVGGRRNAHLSLQALELQALVPHRERVMVANAQVRGLWPLNTRTVGYLDHVA